MSNPTEWPTRVASPMKASAFRAASAGLGAPATSLSVIPCIWWPKIGRPALTNVDQRSTILPFFTRTAAISTRSAISGFVPVVSTSSTTNSAPALTLAAKSSTEPVPASRNGIRFVLPTASWSWSWRSTSGWSARWPNMMASAMTDSGRIFAPASTIMIASRVPETMRSSSDSASWGMVGLITNSPSMRPMRTAADGAEERDLADRQGGRRGDGAEDVRVVLLVRREDRQDDLDVVLVALGEERPDGPVGQASGQDRGLRGARFALDEAAGDLPGRVHPLLEVHREREEVQARAGLGPVRGAEDDSVAVGDGDGSAGQPGELARLDGQGAAAELDGKGEGHERSFLARVGDGPLPAFRADLRMHEAGVLPRPQRVLSGAGRAVR